MTYTPTSALAVRYELLRRTLAYSATFRALCDADDEDAALERIIYPDQVDKLADPDDASKGLLVPRTRAIIDLAEEGWSIAPNGKGYATEALPMLLSFEIAIPETWEETEISSDPATEKLWCEDMWRRIVGELVAAARLNQHPDTGLPFIADTFSIECTFRGAVDAKLPDNDLVYERVYAVDLLLTDACGV